MHAELQDGSELVDAAQNSVNESCNPSAGTKRVLYLYSGPLRETDGFGTFCKANDIACDYVDKEYDDGHDLLDQQIWDGIEVSLSKYHGYLMSPPCSTFTPARNGEDGGPGPLRTSQGPERYGRKNVTPQEKQRVREGTLLAKRAHTTAKVATSEDKPWILEQPHWRPGKTSMFMLDEFQELMSHKNVRLFTLAQCRYGADVEKLTDLLSNRDLTELELRCNHPPRWWRVPWSGERFYGPHPQLRGRQKAIPEEDWNESMLQRYEPSGPYLTRAYAAYPELLNKALADQMAKLLKADGDKNLTKPDLLQHTEQQNVDTKFTMEPTLRKQMQAKQLDDDRWSLRNIYNSMTCKSKLIGKQIGNLIERELDASPEIEAALVENFGKAVTDVVTSDEWVADVRHKLADLLERNRCDGQDSKCDTLPINEGDCRTVVRGHLLEYRATVVNDPAAFAARWLYEGAPAGLSRPIELSGICADVEDDSPELDDVALATDYESFVNYEGVEDNADAAMAISEYHRKGYLRRFNSLEETRQRLGSDPILSKLGCIVKEKVNIETGKITKKTRIILDCKRSLVSKYASRHHKSVLPRITDAVRSSLLMLQDCQRDESVCLFIADVSDAFWLIPLHHSERRFFVAQLNKAYYVFERTAQGRQAEKTGRHDLSGMDASWNSHGLSQGDLVQVSGLDWGVYHSERRRDHRGSHGSQSL